MELDQRRLKEVLDYNPDTGVFIWKIRRKGCGGRVYPGATAGSTKTDGYRAIQVDGQGHLGAHRLAHLYMTGRWPPKGMVVDHINGDRADNRWSNLRLCTRKANYANLNQPVGASGFRGVTKLFGCNSWKAQIRAHGKFHYLGLFATPEEAHAAYCRAAKKLFGKLARLDRPSPKSVTLPQLVINGYAAGITSALC